MDLIAKAMVSAQAASVQGLTLNYIKHESSYHTRHN